MLNGIKKKVFEDNAVPADVRNDEEQSVKLQQILELLTSAGYYRARIKGLADFDKIVGGMTWCIESCQFDVDVDLLFQENLIIGQKIALTEKIVAMLPKMNCPHRIEPHQIQGLDCIHIYPVMQWLVSESMKTRKEMAHYVHTFAVNQFNKNNYYFNKYLFNKDEQEESNIVKNVMLAKSSLNYDRSAVPSSPVYEVKETDKQYKLAFSPEKHITESPALQASKVLEKQKEILQNKVDSLTDDKNQLHNKFLEIKEKLNETRRRKLSLENIFEKMKESDSFTDVELLTKITELLMLLDKLKIQEKEFKDQCHVDLNYFEELVKEVQTKKPQEELDHDVKYEEQKQIIHQLRLKLAKRNRAVASLIRKIDDVPSRSELTQYQKRFMELYNQVSAKHKETKQYYTLYNTLDDTKLYYTKELSLLNSVQDNYNQAMSSSSSREQFIKQFELIVEGVRRNKEKLEKRRTEEICRRDALSRQLVTLMEQQRKYVAAVRQLTIECRNNELLLGRLRGS
ncbi:coiled-coil domain-containing protein 93 [Trichogramma pretiosum]|uniref:coiled-coil domain-containing protein 93 n=1 Tax=Trichogramma pretiosum TaxID=7493 RepID=UPI0006C96112|nr:coiled-coil domain-containing protein 93 [Trichogramma pretiosum]